MYKLIAIDLDGTLLNTKKIISEENIKSIKLAQNKGVKIVICTGRVYPGAKMFAEDFGNFEPIIACNGAIIKGIKPPETYYINPMEKEKTLKVIELCKIYDIYYHVFVDDTLYTERLEGPAFLYNEKNKKLPIEKQIRIVLSDNLLEEIKIISGNILKLIIISDDLEKLRNLRLEVEKIESISVVSSGVDNFEVINKNVSKGEALKYLSKKLGIERDEIIAIGDNENDLSMIEFAGLGIAMSNAIDELKSIADYITVSNDENGVAKAINKFII